MYKTIAITILSIFLSSCATTTTVQHNKSEGSLYLFSHTDPASNDKRITSDSTTQSVIKKLVAKLKKNPRDVETSITLANIYLALSDSKNSIKYAKRALRFNLKEHRARLILAQNYFRQKKFKLAEVVLSSLPPKFNNDPDIINMRGLIAYKRNRRGESWQIFNKGTKDHPKHVALAMNYGVLLLKHRQITLAKSHFERVIGSVPNHTDARIHLAVIHATEGEFDKAEDVIESLTNSNNRLYKFNMGVIAYIKKDYNKSETLLKRFIADKTAQKVSVESAAIILEKITDEREYLANKAIEDEEKKEIKSSSNSLDTKDKEIDQLESELTQ